jgi:hypothetical protein
MRYLPIVLLLFSCSADRLLNMAIKRGAKVTTETVIEYDTIKTLEVKDSLIYVPQVDSSRVKTICDSLINALPKDKPKYITKIQEEVCPDLSELRTLSIPVTVNDSTYHIELDLFLTAKAGHLAAYLTSKPSKISYVSTTSNTKIEAPQKHPWYVKYVLFPLALFGVIAAVSLFFRR